MRKKTKRQIEDEKDYGGRSLFDFIELEFLQGEENEQQNRKLSEHREVTDNIERTSISSNTPSVDRQENSTIQFDNTREMGRVLSEHNQESRNVRSHDTSITTSSNGISNFGEQRSEQEERSGANRYGDTSGRTDKSQSIHSNRTPNLFSFISRNDDERQGTDTRRNNQQSVLETATRNDKSKRRDEKTFFKLESYINFGGFIKRLNNFYNDLEKFAQFNKNKIENLEKEVIELKSITGDNTPKYKRKDYLEALREDNRIVMDEIEKMSKQKNYKSDFVPKSAKILEDLNQCNKIEVYQNRI